MTRNAMDSRRTSFTAGTLIFLLLTTQICFGQTADISRRVPSVKINSNAAVTARPNYLDQVAGSKDEGMPEELAQASESIEKILNAAGTKNAVLIDENANARNIVVADLAARLQSEKRPRSILRIDWARLFEEANGEAGVTAAVDAILKYAEARKSADLIYLGDLTDISTANSMYGSRIAAQIYWAVSESRHPRRYGRCPPRF